VSEAAIETALNILEFTSVLIEETGHYSFVAREFPSIYRRNRKTKVSIGRIKEKLRHELSQGVRNDGAHH